MLDKVPRDVQPGYPKADEKDMVRDITIVVSAKDFLSQQPEQLAALSKKVPKNIRIIYTFPKLLGTSFEDFEKSMQKAAGPLTNVELRPLPAFANPFLGWVVAVKNITTKYTLFMHNDVYAMDDHFLSDLYQAMLEHPEAAVTSPQIYEAEEEEHLCAHVINTGLHLRKKEKDLFMLSHEVSLVQGTDREPTDFKEGVQKNFLEDHAFLIKTNLVEDVVDPGAAFTLEYMDLQLSVRAMNYTVWFTPSSRVEFRVWGSKFRWQDVAFFGYRRSERLARTTKHYLEDKWQVEFPNTGFANYVKFSVPRTAFLANDLEEEDYHIPSSYENQVAMVLGWYEWVGYNKYFIGDSKPGNVSQPELTLPELLHEHMDSLKKTPISAGRNRLPAKPVELRERSKLLDFLEVRDKATFETRLPFEHLSFGVAQIKFTSFDALVSSGIRNMCGLVIRHDDDFSVNCVMYIAPYFYDDIYLNAFEEFLRFFKIPKRVSVYGSFNMMTDLETIQSTIMEYEKIPNVEKISICGEWQDDCSDTIDFTESHTLLQWSGSLNWWGTVRKGLLQIPGATQHVPYEARGWSIYTIIAMCGFAFINLPAMSRRSLISLVVICFGRILCDNLGIKVPQMALTFITSCGFLVLLAHVPIISRKALTWALIGIAIWAYSITPNVQFAAEELLQLFAVLTLGLCAYRAYVLFKTLKASFPASLIFTLLSHNFPAYSFSEERFFNTDNAPEEIVQKRKEAFYKLKEHWDKKWPQSIAMAGRLRGNFSDLRFAAGNRVFLPFKKMLDQWCDPFTVCESTDRMNLIDIDGHRQLDISGSYGVNVCGYDKYKEFLSKGWEMMKNNGCVLGPVHPILEENISMLQKLSGKEEVSFHMSGTEAVMCACRLARFNTGRRLIVVFGGAYHGWWDGVQTTAGNERLATDVLCLKDLSDDALDVIALRGNEIAAVMINPLQSFHPNSPPPSDLALASDNRHAYESSYYVQFLRKVRKLCTRKKIVLLFDEVYTGFRLHPRGAQGYFKVEADMVCYGKTLGGGMPNGVVCGPRDLMNRCDPQKPLRVAYVVGTFSAHPLLLGSMNAFLKHVSRPEAEQDYLDLNKRVAKFCEDTNEILEKNDLPLRVSSYASIWTMLFQQPGRYHWIFQYYLKDEGINLSWVGTGRLNFSEDFKTKDLQEVTKRLLRAAKRMKADGWWYYDEKNSNGLWIKLQLVSELCKAFFASLFA